MTKMKEKKLPHWFIGDERTYEKYINEWHRHCERYEGWTDRKSKLSLFEFILIKHSEKLG